MINQQQIEQVLQDSFADERFSTEEKFQLRELMVSLKEQPDLRAYARNKAFDIAMNSANDGAVAVHVLTWLEKVVKTIDNASKQKEIRVESAFSPGEGCRDLIQQEIKRSQQSIDICVFTITDQKLRDAILEAFHRGIRIRILSDQDKANDLGSDVDYLKQKGVNVLLDTSPWHMHHKFALFDGVRLLNGSFNWTRSATEKNQENLALTDNVELVSAFTREFEQLWQRHSEERA